MEVAFDFQDELVKGQTKYSKALILNLTVGEHKVEGVKSLRWEQLYLSGATGRVAGLLGGSGRRL